MHAVLELVVLLRGRQRVARREACVEHGLNVVRTRAAEGRP